MVNVPVLYTLATALPEMEPNSAEAKIETLAGPPLERRVSTQARSRKTCPNPARWRKHPNMTKAKIMVEDTASGMPYSPSVTRYSCSQSIL